MKKVAIVTTQLLLGLSVVAMGAALLATPAGFAQELASIGLGGTARLGIGGLQMLAGLCLMVPRGHVAGTAILAFMTVGVSILAVVQTAVDAKAGAAVPPLRAAVDGTCGIAKKVGARRDWDI